MPRRARQQYRQHQQLQLPVRASWDEAAIELTNDWGRLRHPWTGFVRMAENDAVILLFFNDCGFYVLPRAALTDDQRDDIHRLASAALAT